jgi:type IV pilus assembly protein PilC
MLITSVALLLLVFYVWLGFKKPGIAFVTCPFVSAGLFALSYENDLMFAAVTAIIIFIVTLGIAALSGAKGERARWPKITARLIFLVLLVLFWLGLVAVGLYFLYTSILFVFLTALIIRYLLMSRHATALYVISTIGSSMRQNLPLPTALEMAASGRQDVGARILKRIQKWLLEGYSLSESIKRGYPKCPGYAVGMIAAGEKIGQLPAALSAIEADMVTKADESRKIRPLNFYLVYAVIVIVVMFVLVLGLMTFVIPQFNSVLIEMIEGGELPLITRLVFRISSFIAYNMGWLIGLVTVVIAPGLIAFYIRMKFRSRRPERPYLSSRIGDFIKWHLPILHWFEKNHSMINTVELLRVSLGAGCTVNKAISNTLGLDVNNCFRKKLGRWLKKVEGGENISQAARQSGLGGTLAWAFDEKVNAGNTLAILETLEEVGRSNYGYRVNLARFIIWPCITIFMGIMVGFVVYAIFSPMVLIISGLSMW